MINEFLEIYPELAAILLLLAGFFFASLLSSLSGKGVQIIERWLQNQLSTPVLATRTARMVERGVYYLVLAVFVLAALRVLGLGALSQTLDVLLDAIPGLVTGIVIMLAGYLTGNFTYQILSRYLGESAGVIVPRLAQGLVVIVAVVTGLAQMSVEVTFIAVTLIAILVTTLGTLGLSFALGSREYVAGLLARRSFAQYAVGDRIRMDDLEGTIVEFNDKSVMIQIEEGIAVVPATIFANAVVIRKTS